MDYKKLYSQYLEQGCVKIGNFLSPEDVQELRKGLKEVVDNIPEEETLTFSVYGAGKNKVLGRDFSKILGRSKIAIMDYKKLYSQYLEQGCVKIGNFLSPEDVQELRKGLKEVVDNIPEEETLTFSVYGAGKNKEADEFFIDSSDKVRYFFENDAFDSEGKLLVDKKEALNKVGYALHWWNPIFKRHTFSEKVKNLLRNFQYKDPVIVQSMLIFKKPKIGEIVKPHQDSTFLYTEPPTCIGLWFPLLEDVTLENGCLWYVPGSHKGKVHQRYVRNPAKDPMLLMEGTLPSYSDDQYVPAPAKIGDCIVIHGSVVHKSGRNTTKVPRTIYTYHMVEKDTKWSEKNWCQPTEKLPFPSIYDN